MKLPFTLCIALLLVQPLIAADLPIVTGVETQPLAAQVRRLLDAAELLGRPFAAAEKTALDEASKLPDADAASAKIQSVLDPHCLFGVTINPEMRVKAAPGSARPELVEQGWRPFFIKVANESGTTAALQVTSPQAQPAFSGGAPPLNSDRKPRDRRAPEPQLKPAEAWLDLQAFNAQPLQPTLSGLRLEYRIISALQPRRRPARGDVRLRCRPGHAGPRLSRRDQHVFSPRNRRATNHAARARRKWRADDRELRFSRPAEARLSLAGEAARAGLRLSSAGLSRGRRNAASCPTAITRSSSRAAPSRSTKNVQREGRCATRANSRFRSSAGSIPRSSAGGRAIITFTPPAARTTRIRPRACTRRT